MKLTATEYFPPLVSQNLSKTKGNSYSIFISGGYNLSRVKGPGSSSLFKPGWQAGSRISWDVHPVFRIASGFIFAKKGFRNTSYSKDVFEYSNLNHSLNYLEVPLVFTLLTVPNKNTEYFLNVGFYSQLLLSANFSYSLKDIQFGIHTDVRENEKAFYKSIEAGYNISGGMLFPLGGKRSKRDYEIGYSIGYEQSFVSASKKGNKIFNRSFVAEVLLRYRLY